MVVKIKQIPYGIMLFRLQCFVLGMIFTFGFWEGFLGSRAFQNIVAPPPEILSVQDRHVYKILAIGESTTARLGGPAWPEFLQEELKQ